jgi:hypothetical protein
MDWIRNTSFSEHVLGNTHRIKMKSMAESENNYSQLFIKNCIFTGVINFINSHFTQNFVNKVLLHAIKAVCVYKMTDNRMNLT